MTKRKMNFFVLLCYFIVIVFLVYIFSTYIFNSPRNAGAATEKRLIAHFPWAIWETFLYVHILTGAIALIIGPLQFLNQSRKNIQFHRTLGKIYVISIFISVPEGVYLAFYATGGIGSTFGFLLLDIIWFYTTFTALKRIKERDIIGHQEWMLRSYAATFVFVTFRLFMPIFVFAIGLGFKVGFPFAILTSIAVNLSIAEWYLRKKRKTIAGINPQSLHS
ncbi:DUF2306 domain-containing protein [Bacillus songklensis]|uniref:DUF2306 domain-containing protein n=1 Tax=Bacillus songklensis TaxID=1069116 RepID=A0ABV8B880_9BACI